MPDDIVNKPFPVLTRCLNTSPNRKQSTIVWLGVDLSVSVYDRLVRCGFALSEYKKQSRGFALSEYKKHIIRNRVRLSC